jgi:SAM-dependent methyltransferase
MFANGKPQNYFSGCNERLLRAVPTSVRRILEIGCGEGNLGVALKKLEPERTVFGIERNAEAAAKAAMRIDRVFTLDIETEDPPLESASIDCILFGDVLEHLIAPDRALMRMKRFLSPDGCILCSVPNIQHHSVIAALLRSDFQYAEVGLLDSTHLRFFTYSTLIKLFLDCGLEPQIVDTTVIPAPKEFLKAAEPLLKYLDLHPGRTQGYLEAYQYILRGVDSRQHTVDSSQDPGVRSQRSGDRNANSVLATHPSSLAPRLGRPLTFVVCVSNEQILQANLLSSPCLSSGSRHEVLLMRGCRSAAEGLNEGIARAKHDMVVCVHQDIYLPAGWPERFWQQVETAERLHGPAGVFGVYGVVRRGAFLTRAGYVVDRDRVLQEHVPLPAVAETLDELLLAIPKDRAGSFDPALGFHFYGADYCLRSGSPAVIIDALCFHNSGHVGVSPQFHESARLFTAKWSQRLPLVTPSAVIDVQGNVSVA